MQTFFKFMPESICEGRSGLCQSLYANISQIYTKVSTQTLVKLMSESIYKGWSGLCQVYMQYRLDLCPSLYANIGQVYAKIYMQTLPLLMGEVLTTAVNLFKFISKG